MEKFEYEQKIIKPGCILLKIKGTLTEEVSLELEQVLDDMIKPEPPHLILDFSDVEFMGSVGFSSLLFIQEKVVEKKKVFALFGLKVEIMSLFKMLGFDHVFTIYKTLDEIMPLCTG